MPPVGLNGSGQDRSYWRSLEALADTPEFRAMVEREFASQAPQLLHPTTRRQFLQLMGASLGLAGLTACRWPREEILPYAHRPEGRLPGVPVQFATAREHHGSAIGLLVTSYDGRPIKIEGNPQHPASLGATDALTQASLLDLYDPDRSRSPWETTEGNPVRRTWEEFDAAFTKQAESFRNGRGSGLAILCEPTASPTVHALRGHLKEKMPNAAWFEYEPLSRDNERAGAALAFGKPLRTHYALDKAEVIVGIEPDLLMGHPASLRYARHFADGRTADGGTMNRLYVAECHYSVTGGMADHRLPIRRSDGVRVLGALAAALLRNGLHLPPEAGDLAAAIRNIAPASPAEKIWIDAAATDLMQARGRCLITVGPWQPPAAHALAHVLNAALGNFDNTVTFTQELDPDRPTHAQAIADLVEAINAGRIKTLIILGGNPVWDAPADLNFGEALARLYRSIHLSEYRNETSQRCTWHVPRAHYLEAWGDARAWDGTISIVQPLIEPLYGGRSIVELLAGLLGEEPRSGYERVRAAFREYAPGDDFEKRWRRCLHEGLVADSAWPRETPTWKRVDWQQTLAPHLDRAADGIELAFHADARVHDGRFANNAWLQELPDPITKITWENALLLAPSTAERLGIANHDVVRITADEAALEMPAFIQPGHAPEAVSVTVGYGRTAAGVVGTGRGVNVYPLRRTDTWTAAGGVRLERTGRRHILATTQDHHTIDRVGIAERTGRLPILYREADLEHYRKHPDFAKHGVEHPPLKQLWAELPQGEHRWGMTIDLTRCIGCSACVVACQAENNIPVVGKDEVLRGREMHWIRVDRHYAGEPDAPQAGFQPVTCHHCENAPCEEVCPVAATMHDEDGLNVMVYNRCIGTRYCSNNCPYKVRRFNWFRNHHGPAHPRHNQGLTDVEKMVFNPNVTVRSRGVMEKCSFCLQRIAAVKITAKNEQRPIRDGEIVPACAQACPTQAIVFGDLNNPASRVRRLQQHPRAYAMLEELNVRPRLLYLARLRNPSAEAASGTRTTETHAT